MATTTLAARRFGPAQKRMRTIMQRRFPGSSTERLEFGGSAQPGVCSYHASFHGKKCRAKALLFWADLFGGGRGFPSANVLAIEAHNSSSDTRFFWYAVFASIAKASAYRALYPDKVYHFVYQTGCVFSLMFDLDQTKKCMHACTTCGRKFLCGFPTDDGSPCVYSAVCKAANAGHRERCEPRAEGGDAFDAFDAGVEEIAARLRRGKYKITVYRSKPGGARLLIGCSMKYGPGWTALLCEIARFFVDVEEVVFDQARAMKTSTQRAPGSNALLADGSVGRRLELVPAAQGAPRRDMVNPAAQFGDGSAPSDVWAGLFGPGVKWPGAVLPPPASAAAFARDAPPPPPPLTPETRAAVSVRMGGADFETDHTFRMHNAGPACPACDGHHGDTVSVVPTAVGTTAVGCRRVLRLFCFANRQKRLVCERTLLRGFCPECDGSFAPAPLPGLVVGPEENPGRIQRDRGRMMVFPKYTADGRRTGGLYDYGVPSSPFPMFWHFPLTTLFGTQWSASYVTVRGVKHFHAARPRPTPWWWFMLDAGRPSLKKWFRCFYLEKGWDLYRPASLALLRAAVSADECVRRPASPAAWTHPERFSSVMLANTRAFARIALALAACGYRPRYGLFMRWFHEHQLPAVGILAVSILSLPRGSVTRESMAAVEPWTWIPRAQQAEVWRRAAALAEILRPPPAPVFVVPRASLPEREPCGGMLGVASITADPRCGASRFLHYAGEWMNKLHRDSEVLLFASVADSVGAFNLQRRTPTEILSFRFMRAPGARRRERLFGLAATGYPVSLPRRRPALVFDPEKACIYPKREPHLPRQGTQLYNAPKTIRAVACAGLFNWGPIATKQWQGRLVAEPPRSSRLKKPFGATKHWKIPHCMASWASSRVFNVGDADEAGEKITDLQRQRSWKSNTFSVWGVLFSPPGRLRPVEVDALCLSLPPPPSTTGGLLRAKLRRDVRTGDFKISFADEEHLHFPAARSPDCAPLDANSLLIDLSDPTPPRLRRGVTRGKREAVVFVFFAPAGLFDTGVYVRLMRQIFRGAGVTSSSQERVVITVGGGARGNPTTYMAGYENAGVMPDALMVGQKGLQRGIYSNRDDRGLVSRRKGGGSRAKMPPVPPGYSARPPRPPPPPPPRKTRDDRGRARGSDADTGRTRKTRSDMGVLKGPKGPNKKKIKKNGPGKTRKTRSDKGVPNKKKGLHKKRRKRQ